MQLKLKLTLPRSNYFHVRATGEIDAFLPFNAGTILGGDNTCSALVTYIAAIRGDQSRKIIDIQTDAKRMIATLQHQIAIVEKFNLSKAALKILMKQLEQFKAWQTLLRILIPPLAAKLEEYKDGYPPLPQPIQDALDSDNNNCVAIRLSPTCMDGFIKFPALFSSNRNPDDKNSFAGVSKKIHAIFNQEIVNLKTATDLFIERVVAIVKHTKITNDQELQQLKQAMNQAFKEANLQLSCITHQCKNRDEPANFKYFTDTALLVDSAASISEWASILFKLSLENTSANFPFIPFHENKTGDNFHIQEGDEFFYIKLQLFLGIINIYHYAKTGKRINFAKILESNSKLMGSLIEHVKSGAKDNFAIENHVLRFFDSHKGKFFGYSLTPNEEQIIKEQFATICQILANGAPDHYDEFLFNVPNRRGDFTIFNAQFTMHLGKFTKSQNLKLYLSHFKVGILPSEAPSNPTNILTSSSEGFGVVISFDQLISLDADTLADLLLMNVQDTYFFEKLTNEQTVLFKRHHDWGSIYRTILQNENLSSILINKFSTKFGLIHCYLLSLTEADALCTDLALSDPSSSASILGLYGRTKVEQVLLKYHINLKSIHFTESHDYLIQFHSSDDYKGANDHLSPIIRNNRLRLYINPEMVDLFCASAESWSTPSHDIRTELTECSNKSLIETKIACAIRHLLNLKKDDIIPANIRTTLQPGQLRLNFAPQRHGYIVEVSQEGLPLLRRLSQIYYDSCSIILTEQQTNFIKQKILTDAKTDSDKTLESVLQKINLQYIGIRKYGSGWIILVATKASKDKIAALRHEALTANIAKQNEIVYEKIKKLREQLSLGTSFSYDSNGSIIEVTLEFKDEQERSYFSSGCEIAVPKQQKGKMTLNVSASFIEQLNISDLCRYYLTCNHPEFVSRVKENANVFHQSLLSTCKIQFVIPKVHKVNADKNKHEPVTQILFTLNPGDPITMFIGDYLKTHYGCELNEKYTLICKPFLFLENPRPMMKTITQSYISQMQATFETSTSSPLLITRNWRSFSNTPTMTTADSRRILMRSTSFREKTTEFYALRHEYPIVPSLVHLICYKANQLNKARSNKLAKSGFEKIRSAITQTLGIEECNIITLEYRIDETYNGYYLTTNIPLKNLDNLMYWEKSELTGLKQESIAILAQYAKISSNPEHPKIFARMNALASSIKQSPTIHDLVLLFENQRDLAQGTQNPRTISASFCPQEWTIGKEGLPKSPRFLEDMVRCINLCLGITSISDEEHENSLSVKNS